MYKRQGLNRRQLMTGAYSEFLVDGAELQAPIPSTKTIGTVNPRLARRGTAEAAPPTPCPLGAGSRPDQTKTVGTRATVFSVARVRPRTSKGITDLLLISLT